MEKTHLKIYFFILLVTTISGSCGLNKQMLEVLDGNLKYNRGDYTGATISYMKVRDHKKYEAWVHYNLGNAYSALGEIDPAIEEIKQSLTEDDMTILHRVNFNLGVIYFELGEFNKAVDHFKEALRNNQKDIDAKINLELAVKMFSSQQEMEEMQILNPPARDKPLGDDMVELLKKVQDKEEEVWQSITKKNPIPDLEDW